VEDDNFAFLAAIAFEKFVKIKVLRDLGFAGNV